MSIEEIGQQTVERMRPIAAQAKAQAGKEVEPILMMHPLRFACVEPFLTIVDGVPRIDGVQVLPCDEIGLDTMRIMVYAKSETTGGEALEAIANRAVEVSGGSRGPTVKHRRR